MQDERTGMYSEADDFKQHDREIDQLFTAMHDLKVSLSPEAMALDVGGGQGMHVWRLLPLVKKLFVADVIDFSSLYDGHFLHLLQEKHERNQRAFDLRKVVFVETDAQCLLFRDAMFDLVFSFNAFEHIPNPEQAWREVLRVSRAGAFLFLQFDPLWTSPTGGHFFHRVPEPWAHLLCSDDTYTDRMRAGGATDFEISEFHNAMNRVRFDQFLRVFRESQSSNAIRILELTTWPSSRADEPHTTHSNFSILLERGYSEEELIVRGIRLCATRLPTPDH